jgi:predicted nucleic acid-binding protein
LSIGIVFDASALAKVLLAEDGSIAAKSYFMDTESVIVPDLLYSEVGNVLYKKFRAGEILADELVFLTSAFQELSLIVHATWEFLPQAIDLAIRMQHNSVYDCIYLALAISCKSPLLTADKAFAEKCRKHGHGDSLLLI